MSKNIDTYRVGIIPFQIVDGDVSLLFVTSQTRNRWALPKGRRKASETNVETCHREGFEEAGVRGVVLEDFPSTVVIGKQTEKGLLHVAVTYYPFIVQKQEKSWPEKKQRQRHWAMIKDAMKMANREDYRPLIKQFESLLPWIIEAAEPYKVPGPARKKKAG